MIEIRKELRITSLHTTRINRKKDNANLDKLFRQTMSKRKIDVRMHGDELRTKYVGSTSKLVCVIILSQNIARSQFVISYHFKTKIDFFAGCFPVLSPSMFIGLPFLFIS